jgi:HD-like signal output (HDOD) protein
MDNGTLQPVSPDIPIDLQVQRRLIDIGRLVSLPQTTFRLLNLLAEEKTTPTQLQSIIEQDPALTAKVMSLSNSSYYSLTKPVSSISRAIVVIGFKELESIALGLGLAETFDLKKVPTGFDGKALWLHSLAVSWIARELAVYTKQVGTTEAMIAGLLHELGTIILVSKFPVHFQQLFDLINSGMGFRKAETTLSLRHEVIGYVLAKSWGLPQVYQEVILYHHEPNLCRNYQKTASLIALSDNLAHRAGFSLNTEALDIDLPNILKILDLNADLLQNFVKNILKNIEKVEVVWEISISATTVGAGKPGKLSSLAKPASTIKS